MKKVRVIVAVVAVALMVMGIGYAAWSQSLPMYVNGTTSEINVQYSGVRFDFNSYLQTSATIASDKKSLCMRINNLYPAAYATYTVDITNYGTMPVIMKALRMDPDLSYPAGWLWDGVNEANMVVTVSSDSPVCNFPLVNGDSTLAPLAIRFEPNETKHFTFTVRMSNTTDLGLQNEEFGFDLTPIFETTAQ